MFFYLYTLKTTGRLIKWKTFLDKYNLSSDVIPLLHLMKIMTIYIWKKPKIYWPQMSLMRH